MHPRNLNYLGNHGPGRPWMVRRKSRWHSIVAGFPILMLASIIGFSGNSQEVQEVAGAKKAPDPFADLPADTARKLNDAFAKWLGAVATPRQRLVEKRLLADIEEMAEEFSLNESSVAILKEASKKAVEESRKPWEEVMIDWIKTIYVEQVNQGGTDPGEFINEIVDSMTNVDESDIESMLEEAPISDKASPRNQPAWMAGLEKALSPDQFAEVSEQANLEKLQAEKQLADLRERMLKAVESQLRTEIKPMVELLRNTIPMDEARAKAVDAAAAAAVAQALEIRQVFLTEMLDKIPPSARQQMMVNDIDGNFAFGNDGQEEAVPSAQKAWTEGLAKILTPDEAVDWKKARDASDADQKKRAIEQLARLIETFSDNYRQNFSRQMDPLVADIRSSVDLGAERQKKLEEASQTAIDSAIDAWKKKATAEVGKMPPRQREMMLQQGYVSVSWDKDEQPENQKIWKDTLATLLNPEEKKQWDNSIQRRKVSRSRTATLVLVSALDDQLAFTTEQRTRLEPLLAKTAVAQLAQRLEQQWGSMNYQSLASIARQADHAEIKKLLADWQKELWTERIEKAEPEEGIQNRGEAAPQGDPDNAEPHLGPDPIASESLISEYLHRLMRQERDRIQARLFAAANDLARAAQLSPEKRRTFHIALKGAAEDELNGWFNQYNQWFRSQIGAATQNPETIRALLQGVGRVNFGRQTPAEESVIWKNATTHLLTESERAAWRKELSSREAYRNTATLALVLQQLDNSARLNEAQMKKLAALASISLTAYGPDISRYFGSRDQNSPWELNSYYNMLVLQGIPEKEFKEVLTPKQWETWETEFRPRTMGYWSNIERFHQERKKAEKEKATPNPPAKKS